MLSFLLTNVLHSNVLLPRRADEKGGSALSGPRHRRRIDWGGRRGTGRSGNPAVLLARWLFFSLLLLLLVNKIQGSFLRDDVSKPDISGLTFGKIQKI